jgi:hypothetical protein
VKSLILMVNIHVVGDSENQTTSTWHSALKNSQPLGLYKRANLLVKVNPIVIVTGYVIIHFHAVHEMASLKLSDSVSMFYISVRNVSAISHHIHVTTPDFVITEICQHGNLLIILMEALPSGSYVTVTSSFDNYHMYCQHIVGTTSMWEN